MAELVHLSPGTKDFHCVVPTTHSVPSFQFIKRRKNEKARLLCENSAEGSNESGESRVPQVVMAAAVGDLWTKDYFSDGSDTTNRCFTCSLVQAVTKEHFRRCDLLFEKVLLLFKLHVLSAKFVQVKSLANGDDDDSLSECTAIAEDAFAMLESVVVQLIPIRDASDRLLPQRRELKEPSLLGDTNGKMLHNILSVFESYDVIPTGDRSPAWQTLLGMVIKKNVHALIDTGALLADVLNTDAAEYLLALPGFAFAAVTYYDTRKRFDCWVAMESGSKCVTRLKNSAGLENDTFVILDDAHSRGSDMKLQSSAVAIVTLAPKLTKDKLVQGAGRMRQLGSDQKLWFASLNEVAKSILKSSGKNDVSVIGACDILDWVMENTKSEATHGLLDWATSGLHFYRTQANPDADHLDEDWTLESLDAVALEEFVRERFEPQAHVSSSVERCTGVWYDELFLDGGLVDCGCDG